MASAGANPAVFINCPFDDEYRQLFQAMVFTIQRCGFAPRCALELVDGAGTRIDKILNIIRECPLGVHDISRTEPDAVNGLPRFNMPFELGLFLGAQRFGNQQQRSKRCLILDRERHRYQKFLSDIAGQDISSHNTSVADIIEKLRDFLRTHSGGRLLPSGAKVAEDYAAFEARKPALCAAIDLNPSKLSFVDLSYVIATYLLEVAV